jgi:hypothetical protein
LHKLRGYKNTPTHRAGVFFAEATTGFEPVIRVLQTLALPLGHVAMRDDSIVTDDGIRAVHKTHIS